jgi:deoxyribose-phosphate aldolase
MNMEPGTQTAPQLSVASNRRNPGMALRPEMFEGHPANRSAAERRTASLTARRSVKKEWQAAWLVNAIRCIDLTTLSGDDTADRVRRLCAKARQPLAPHIVKGLGIEDLA